MLTVTKRLPPYATKVVFTGPGVVNGGHVTRDVLQAAAKKAGIQVQTKVTRNTTFLVTDAKIFETAKGVAAYNYNVERISTEDFICLYDLKLELRQKDLTS